MKISFHSLFAAGALLPGALLAATATPAIAQEQVAPDRYAVTLHEADLHPQSPKAARAMHARIDKAALAVCGLSSSALREAKTAMRRSDCWRDSVAAAMAQVDGPRLVRSDGASSDGQAGTR